MHPRTETRKDLKDLLVAALPGIPVYASLVRKLRQNEREAVIVYTLEEELKRPSSPSRRPSQPYSRAMTLGVVVSVLASGDGEEAGDRADEIARQIELAVNAIPDGPDLTSCRIAAEEGQQTRCTVDLIYKLTKARKIDPFTCLVTQAAYTDFREHRIDELDFKVIANAQQPRAENLTIPLSVGLADVGGQVSLTEEAAAEGLEKYAEVIMSRSYEVGTEGRFLTRFGVDASLFTTLSPSGIALRSSLRKIIVALARRAARIALLRAHCVEVAVDIDASRVMPFLDLDLRDRVEIVDAGIHGGRIVGKVIGCQLDINGSVATGRLIVACPASGGGAAVSVGDEGHPTDGLARLSVPESLDDAPGVTWTQATAAVANSDTSYLVEDLDLLDPGIEQREAIGPTDPITVQVEKPEQSMPETGIYLKLRDLTPTRDLIIRNLRLSECRLTLPEGIAL